MRTTLPLRLLCVASLAALAFAAQAPAAEPAEITASEAVALEKSGDKPFYVDVRSPAEYAAGRVPGAVNIPRDRIPQHLDELKAARDRLVVYCERGPRAIAAAEALAQAGFENVRRLKGDMAGWRAAGLPIEK
jgi:phage shock protein E